MYTDGIAVDVLSSYWASGDIATLPEFRAVVGVYDTDFLASPDVSFSLVLDDGSPLEIVEAVTVTAEGVYELFVTREMIARYFTAGSELKVAMTQQEGYSVGTVEFTGAVSEGTEVNIDDGTNNTDFTFGTYETGSVQFTAQATSGDIVTIDDGVNDPVAFTFGVGAGLILVGADASASGQNFKAAVDAAVTAGDLDVVTSGAGATITIGNRAGFTGGSITETADPGTDMTVTDFSGGVDGIALGSTAAESAQNFYDAVAADTNIDVQVSIDGAVVTVYNVAAGKDTVDGAITENTDTGNDVTVTDFDTPVLSTNFWAYLAPRNS
jgi:hypothetical protein